MILLRRRETFLLDTCPVPEVTVPWNLALAGNLDQLNPTRAGIHKVVARQAQLLRSQNVEAVYPQENANTPSRRSRGATSHRAPPHARRGFPAGQTGTDSA